jgi:hypothetical protein
VRCVPLLVRSDASILRDHPIMAPRAVVELSTFDIARVHLSFPLFRT